MIEQSRLTSGIDNADDPAVSLLFTTDAKLRREGQISTVGAGLIPVDMQIGAARLVTLSWNFSTGASSSLPTILEQRHQ
jgi:hypothetical protein